MNTIYITRHSEPLRDLVYYNSNDSLQLQNEKTPLSVGGGEKAKKLSEVGNIDLIYTSNYVRAIDTAKHVAFENGLKINIDDRFRERKFGINSWDELPKDFGKKQFFDWNYKTQLGESLNEVNNRMTGALFEILNNCNDKNILIVSHSTAMVSLFKNWCDIKPNLDNEKLEIYFNGNLVFDGNWDAPEVFKLSFDGKKLVDIVNIKL